MPPRTRIITDDSRRRAILTRAATAARLDLIQPPSLESPSLIITDPASLPRITTALPVLVAAYLWEPIESIISQINPPQRDWILHPIRPRELAARAETLTREQPLPATPAIIYLPGLIMDPYRHTITINGVTTRLTTPQSKLLTILASHPGLYISRKDLAALLDLSATKQVTMAVARLKTTLVRAGCSPDCITSRQGIGYALSANPLGQ